MELAFSINTAVVIQMILAVFMPIAVGLVTTRVTASSVKAWLLAAFTLISSILVELLHAINSAAATFDLGAALLAVIPTFAISVATYYGLWKPTGIGGAAQDVDSTTIVR